MSNADGLVIIDKPAGWTSHDVVKKVKGMLRAQKVGHTGTLDPEATGVLVLCVNKATRWASDLCDLGKSYAATIQLGVATETADQAGQVLSRCEVPILVESQIQKALAQFCGEIEQQVPKYSAVKVGGRRLHRLARAGQAPAQFPRRCVTIEALELTDWEPPDQLSIQVHCSKGTYIRSLAEDIGVALGTVAHLKFLRRLSVGPFGVAEAISLSGLAEQIEQERFLLRSWPL